MARTAIFDLDGTLVNTLYDLAASSNQVLMRLGLPTHEVDAYRFFVGEGVGHLCRRAVGSSASAAILALHERLYRAQFSRYGHPSRVLMMVSRDCWRPWQSAAFKWRC